jgi:hypothetical protein
MAPHIASSLSLVLLLQAGCGDSPVPEPLRQTGYLTLSWTIRSSRDPANCFANGAAGFELVMKDELDLEVARIAVPCYHLMASLQLYEGTYTASARLVDLDDKAQSSVLVLNDLAVQPHAEVTILIDFPVTALLGAGS